MSFECPKCEARSWGARCTQCGEQLIPDSFADSGALALDARPVARAAEALDVRRLQGAAERLEVARPAPAGRWGAEVPLLELSYRWSERPWRLLLIAAVLFAFGLGMPFVARLIVGAVVAPLLYVAAAFSLNSTRIRVEGGALHVSHGPLPWLSGERIALEKIDQVFVRTTYGSKRGDNLSWSWSWGLFRPRVVDVTYGVVAALQGGERVTLLSGRPDLAEAVALERRLEDHLGIVDDRSAAVVDD